MWEITVSLLAMMEVPRDQRDFVGRWSAASSSDEYLRTARQLVMRLQERAAVALEQPAAHDLRFAGIEELLAFLRKQGLDIAEQTDFKSCCNWISLGWLPCKSAMGLSLLRLSLVRSRSRRTMRQWRRIKDLTLARASLPWLVDVSFAVFTVKEAVGLCRLTSGR